MPKLIYGGISDEIHKEAILYRKQIDNRVICNLCPHYCLINEGDSGICQVRQNRGGTLYSLVFGNPVIQNVDPIEKKPLFHFRPGTSTYSIATHGCNFHCDYCINWELSQTLENKSHRFMAVSPEQIVINAQEAGCRSIAYTYVEPTIFFEYAHEIASLAARSGLFNVFKTNGFFTNEMLDLCSPYLNAINVDLKTFSDHTYHKLGGRLQPVLDTLKHIKTRKTWLEVTTVIIPGVNDDTSEIKEIASFIANELGADTPWHIARFFPAYKMDNVPPTPVSTLHHAQDIGLAEGLHYVYLSGLLEYGKQDTRCHHCGQVLVRRRGSELLELSIRNGYCPDCGVSIPGVWSDDSEKAPV